MTLAGTNILVSGTADSGTGAGDFALVRYLSEGQLDPSFGSGGVVITPGPEDELIWATAILPGGKILAAGYGGGPSTGLQFRLARYVETGALDPTFGGTGVVTTQIGAYSGAVSLAVEADGKAIAGGWSNRDGPGFALVRYDADGSLDESFGDAGTRLYPVGTFGGDGTSLGIQQLAGRERLVQGGTAWEPGGGNFAVIGIRLDGPPAPPPPQPPPPQPPPPLVQCVVPRVVGQTVRRARARIRARRCLVGRIRRTPSSQARGRVIRQRPRAGSHRPRGTRVSLVVSRGRR